MRLRQRMPFFKDFGHKTQPGLSGWFPRSATNHMQFFIKHTTTVAVYNSNEKINPVFDGSGQPARLS